MKKMLIFALAALTTFCATAQEMKRKGNTWHRYSAELRNHSLQELTNPTPGLLRSGMTIPKTETDKMEGITNALLTFGVRHGNQITLTDMYGDRFTVPMITSPPALYEMEKQAFLTESDGSIRAMAWLDDGTRVWINRPPTIINGVDEKFLAFDVGEYYEIPSLIGVKILYQAQACMNPVSMVKGWYTPKKPKQKTCQLADSQWHSKKQTVDYKFFYRKREQRFISRTCCVESVVVREFHPFIGSPGFWMVSGLAVNGAGIWLVDYLCKSGSFGGSSTSGTSTPTNTQKNDTTVVDSGGNIKHPTGQKSSSRPDVINPNPKTIVSSGPDPRSFNLMQVPTAFIKTNQRPKQKELVFAPVFELKFSVYLNRGHGIKSALEHSETKLKMVSFAAFANN